MSKQYVETIGKASAPTTSAEMRIHSSRPGKQDEEGNPIYFTEQHHKKECDVNLIIKKYDKTGLISHVSKFEGKFGDMTGIEFQTMQNKVANAKSMFNELPAEIRKEFNNNPKNLLEFMENPANRPKAIELGLIDSQWTEETDGLGEHVKEGENIKPPERVDTPPEV